MSAAARAIAFRHAIHAAVCDRLEPWEHGTAVFATQMPSFYAYNAVRVEDAAADLDAGALAGAAHRLQAGLGHRQVEVEDTAAGERLRPGLRTLGWHTERDVWMELVGGPRSTDDPAGAEIGEVPFARTRALREAWFGTLPFSAGPGGTSGFVALEDAVAALRGTRAMAAWGAAGEIVGFVAFSTAADAAEVEQLYVAPPHRGQGTGAALVRAAVAAAGAPRTWIVADDEGAAKRLYARLGFSPAWVQHVCTLAPA